MPYFKCAPHPPSERRTDAGRLPPWLPGVALFDTGWCWMGSVMSAHEPESPVCSAKGCRAAAVWVLAWNNPKLHTPERRKTWLACEEHREHLSSFLGMRGFLKDVVRLAEWEAAERDDDRGHDDTRRDSSTGPDDTAGPRSAEES